MKKELVFGGILILLVLGLGVLFSQNHQNSGVIKIGAAVGLSGDCAEWGEGELKSYKLAIDEINARGGISGRAVDLQTEDTQCDPDGTFNAVQKLISIDKVEAILGPTWGDSFQAGFELSSKQGVVAVAPSAVLKALVDNQLSVEHIFSTWFPVESEMSALGAYMHQVGVKNIVLVHDNDPYGAIVAETFAQQSSAHGLEVLKDYRLPIDYGDYKTTIATIKSLKPDAVFVSFKTPAAQATFMKQAHELRLTARLFTSSQIEDASLLQNFASGMEGAVYAYPDVSGNYDGFKAKYVAKYQTEPQGPSASNAYDAAQILIFALGEKGLTGTDLTKALETTSLPGTVTKTLSFDQTHQLSNLTYQIKTIHDGQFVVE